jgi:hypothetical protein
MSVYVDPARFPYGRMIMCHMIADTPDEVHAMADKIGVARKWFQTDGSTPHYDICKAKRALAVQSGALELGVREFLIAARYIRQSRSWQREKQEDTP